MTKPKLYAWHIVKAATFHAEDIGGLGLAMLTALCTKWDDLGCERAVCWANSRLAEKSGISRNSINRVRARLIEMGWIKYTQNGRNSGSYVPCMPNVNAQNSAMQCAERIEQQESNAPQVAPSPAPQVAQNCATNSANGGNLSSHPLPFPSLPESDQANNQDQPVNDSEDLFGNPSPAPAEQPLPEVNAMDLMQRYGGRIRGSRQDKMDNLASWIAEYGAEQVEQQLASNRKSRFITEITDALAEQAEQGSRDYEAEANAAMIAACQQMDEWEEQHGPV